MIMITLGDALRKGGVVERVLNVHMGLFKHFCYQITHHELHSEILKDKIIEAGRKLYHFTLFRGFPSSLGESAELSPQLKPSANNSRALSPFHSPTSTNTQVIPRSPHYRPS